MPTIWRGTSGTTAAITGLIDWSEQENPAIRDYTDNWQRNYAEKNKRYDIDSIFCALRAGLHDYLTGSAHVFTSYQDIGAAFPANYMEG